MIQSVFAPIHVLGIDFEFFLFAATLVGIAVFHHKTLQVAVTGLAAVLLYKLLFTEFNFISHTVHEAHGLLNLFGLLIGFAILAKIFEHSGVPAKLPHYLPDDWKGPFVLLIIVFILSAFLDSIAAVMIGGGMAHTMFRKRVHIAYIVGIVAASNAGGSGSVLGNITTTMMWVEGVAAIDVMHAYGAAIPALIISGIPASIMQDKFQPILKDEIAGVRISWKRIGVSFMIIAGAITANVLIDFPAVGVWAGILIGSLIVQSEWSEGKHALSGSAFLMSLVFTASMMPVEQLPAASWQTAFGLGFISSVFDNIPLTKLALTQGGYDWGVLAFTVGYGGSMIWFGSSAGVAISNMFEEVRSVRHWFLNAWHVIIAYVASFFIMLYLLGWHPHAPHKKGGQPHAKQQVTAVSPEIVS